MIEVRNADVAKVPKNWIKISGTKAVSRFHSPQIVKLIQEREQRKNLLELNVIEHILLFFGTKSHSKN